MAVGPDLIYTGGGDAFVAKVDPSGRFLVYAGYIGGHRRTMGATSRWTRPAAPT